MKVAMMEIILISMVKEMGVAPHFLQLVES